MGPCRNAAALSPAPPSITCHQRRLLLLLGHKDKNGLRRNKMKGPPGTAASVQRAIKTNLKEQKTCSKCCPPSHHREINSVPFTVLGSHCLLLCCGNHQHKTERPDGLLVGERFCFARYTDGTAEQNSANWHPFFPVICGGKGCKAQNIVLFSQYPLDNIILHPG